MKKILAILGSNSKTSTNRLLLENIMKIANEKVEIEIVEISEIPLKRKLAYSENIDQIIKKIESSQGLIIASNELVHAPSAALINLLDWLAAPPFYMKNKPMFLCSASHGKVGSVKALIILKQILEAENLSPIIFQKDFILSDSLKAFDENGKLIIENERIKLTVLLDEFLDFIELLKGGNL